MSLLGPLGLLLPVGGDVAGKSARPGARLTALLVSAVERDAEPVSRLGRPGRPGPSMQTAEEEKFPLGGDRDKLMIEPPIGLRIFMPILSDFLRLTSEALNWTAKVSGKRWKESTNPSAAKVETMFLMSERGADKGMF